MKFNLGSIALFSFGALMVGCGGNSPSTITASNAVNIEPLKNGMMYEGWAIVGGAPKSFGVFNVNMDGKLVNRAGALMPNFGIPPEYASASKIIITIEPAVDTDPGPADTHFLAGDVNSLEAVLTTDDAAALGSNFTAATGSFLLATPTQNPSNLNPLSGVWFLKPGPAAGLSLPTLPAGWQYEGWAVIGGQPVTTGKFLSATGSDLSSTFSGPNADPGFPGEDFLVNPPAGLTFPTNLVGSPVVISIEPMPDDSPAPFSLKPLVGTPPAGTTMGQVINMNNQAASTAPMLRLKINQ